MPTAPAHSESVVSPRPASSASQSLSPPPPQSPPTQPRRSQSYDSVIVPPSTSVDSLNSYVKRQASRGMELLDEEGEKVLHLLRGEHAETSAGQQMDSMNYDNVLDYMHVSDIGDAWDQWVMVGLMFLMTILIAFITAMLMYGVTLIVHWAAAKRITNTVELIETGYSAAAYFTFTIISIVITAVASGLCTVVAPHARGGGVPYLFAYLNGTNVSQFFTLRTVTTKVVALAFTIAGGLTLGMEGPFVYIGGGVALLLCRGWDYLPGVASQGKYSRLLRSINEERIFMACGLAAGLAVAFNAPIAGILFAMEGATSFLTISAVLRIFGCSMFAMFFKQLAFNGWSSHIKITNLITIAENNVNYTWRVPEIAAFTLMAIIGGLLGIVAVHLNVRITKWRHHYMEDRIRANMSEVALVTGVTASIWFVLPLMFGCKIMPTFCADSGEDRCQQLYCPIGSYSELGSIIFASSEILTKNLLDRTIPAHYEYDIFPLLVYLIFYLFLTSWVYGAYVPGGLFVPSIVIGACYGRVVGIIGSQNVSGDINPGVYALLGAAGMLGGFTRLGLPVVVMLVEMTGDATYLLPIMYIATLAKLFADQIEPPLYPQHMAIEQIKQIGDKIPINIAAMKAEDIMDRLFQPIEVTPKLARVLDVLDISKATEFPVVDCEGRFEGFIQRTQLIHRLKVGPHYQTEELALKSSLIKRRLSSRRASVSRISDSNDESESLSLTQTGGGGTPIVNNRVSMLAAEGEFGIDWRNTDAADALYDPTSNIYDDEWGNRFTNLRPVTDTGVIVVQQKTSNKRVHAIFRKIGLAHLPVVDNQHKLKGLITRRCLLVPPVKHEGGGGHSGHSGSESHYIDSQHVSVDANHSAEIVASSADDAVSATIIINNDTDNATTNNTGDPHTPNRMGTGGSSINTMISDEVEEDDDSSSLDDDELITESIVERRREHARQKSIAQRVQQHIEQLR